MCLATNFKCSDIWRRTCYHKCLKTKYFRIIRLVLVQFFDPDPDPGYSNIKYLYKDLGI